MNQTELLLVAALILGSSVPTALAAPVPDEMEVALTKALRGEAPFVAPSNEEARRKMAQAVNERLVNIDADLKDVDSLTPEQVNKITARIDPAKLDELRLLILFHKSLGAATPEAGAPFAPAAAPSAAPDAARESLARDMSRSVSMTSLSAGTELSFDGAGARDALAAGAPPTVQVAPLSPAALRVAALPSDPPPAPGDGLVTRWEEIPRLESHWMWGDKKVTQLRSVRLRPVGDGRLEFVSSAVKATRVERVEDTGGLDRARETHAATPGFGAAFATVGSGLKRLFNLGLGGTRYAVAAAGGGVGEGFVAHNRVEGLAGLMRFKFPDGKARIAAIEKELPSMSREELADIDVGVEMDRKAMLPLLALTTDPKLAKAREWARKMIEARDGADVEAYRRFITAPGTKAERAWSVSETRGPGTDSLYFARLAGESGSAMMGAWASTVGFAEIMAETLPLFGPLKLLGAATKVEATTRAGSAFVLAAKGTQVGLLGYGGTGMVLGVAGGSRDMSDAIEAGDLQKAGLVGGRLAADMVFSAVTAKGLRDMWRASGKGKGQSGVGGPTPEEVLAAARETLGVEPGASWAEIKAAHRRLLWELDHRINRIVPDALDPTKNRVIADAEATAKVQRIHDALKVLERAQEAKVPSSATQPASEPAPEPAPAASDPGLPAVVGRASPTQVVGRAAPLALPGGPFGGREYVPVERLEDIDAAAAVVFAGRPLPLAIADYLKPPSSKEADQLRRRLKRLIPLLGPDNLAFTNGDVLAPGSADASITSAAQEHRIPMMPLSAKRYVGRSSVGPFSEDVDVEAYRHVTKFVFEDTSQYSKGAARLTKALIHTGGRDATIGDVVDAIEEGNVVAVVRNTDSTEPTWDATKGMSGYSPAYVVEQLKSFRATGKLAYPATRGFDEEFLKRHWQDIERLVRVYEGNEAYVESPEVDQAIADQLKGALSSPKGVRAPGADVAGRQAAAKASIGRAVNDFFGGRRGPANGVNAVGDPASHLPDIGTLPTGPAGSGVVDFVKGFLGLGGAVEAKAPETEAHSGDEVFMLTQDGSPAAVAKVYRTPKAREGVVNELAGAEVLARLGPTRSRAVETHGAFAAGPDHVIQVMEAAPGRDVYGALREVGKARGAQERGRALAEAREEVEATARAVGEIHRLGRSEGVSKDLVAYDVSTAKKMAARLKGSLPADLHAELTDQVERLGTAVIGSGAPGTINHGDMHPGNVLIKKGGVTMIDLENVRYSVDAEGRGVGNPAADVGRFVGAIRVNNEVKGLGLSEAELKEVEDAFVAEYAKESGVPIDALADDLAFYRLRLGMTAILRDPANTDGYAAELRKMLAEKKAGAGGALVQGRAPVETRDAGLWERLRAFVTGTPAREGRAPAEFGSEAEAAVKDLRSETRAALEAEKGRLVRYLSVLRPGADAGAAYEKLLASVDTMDIRLAERGTLSAKASHVKEKASGREYVVFRTDVLGSSPEVRRAVLAHELFHSAGFGEFTTHMVEAILGGRGDAASSDPHQVDQARLHKAMRQGELGALVLKGYGVGKLAADGEPENMLRLSKEGLSRARATETPADRRDALERVDEQRRAMGLRIPQDAAIVKQFERLKDRQNLTEADLVEAVDLGRRVRAAGLPTKPFVDQLFYDAVDVKALPEYGIKLRVGDAAGGDPVVRAKILDAFLAAVKTVGEPVDFKVGLFMRRMTGTQAGKFITIYTRDPVKALKLADSLEAGMADQGLLGTRPTEDFAFGRSGLVSWAAAGYKSREFSVPDGRGGWKVIRDDPARRAEVLDSMAHLPGMEPWVELAETTPQMARHREWTRGLETAGREPAPLKPTAEQFRWYEKYDAGGREDTLDADWKWAVVRYMDANPTFKP